jgi:hypothetical protein
VRKDANFTTKGALLERVSGFLTLASESSSLSREISIDRIVCV